jgi:hypothetical protein
MSLLAGWDGLPMPAAEPTRNRLVSLRMQILPTDSDDKKRGSLPGRPFDLLRT